MDPAVTGGAAPNFNFMAQSGASFVGYPKCLMCGQYVTNAGPAHQCIPITDRVTQLESAVFELQRQVAELQKKVT